MKKIKTLVEANNILASFVPLSKHITGKDMTLGRMVKLLERVGNPHESLKVVHIAGTSGKTSTAYFMAALLHESGAKVGLTVSPHIDSVTERIQVDGAPLSDSDSCKYLSEFLELIDDINPTYFELIIAFAYWVFAKLNVDYAVIETGLGGLHDCTNVATRPDKVCVITDIGFDHMNILGNTLPEIAAQKAGIIHEDSQVFMYLQTTEIMKPVVDRCAAKGATLNTVRTKVVDPTSSLPLFQQHNWTLARGVYEYLSLRDNLPILTDEQILASQIIQVPGRMDTTSIGAKTVIMDGAHNQQKMHAFVTSFQSKYPGAEATVMLSLKQDKEFPKVIDELLPVTSSLILTTFATTQDRPGTAINPEEIATYCYAKGFDKVQVIVSQAEAYKELLRSDNNLLVITGSFYLLSQLRAELNHK
jgi:dihydrofolate synthase/folylpolyglutamate synthase